jgi:bacterioferritin-associated ferredoxin
MVKIFYPGRCEIVWNPQAAFQDTVLSVRGSESLIRCIQERLEGSRDPKSWPISAEHSSEALILKEFILKAKGQWNPPYQEEMICFCRSIETQQICEAIISGVHHIDDLRELTTVNTGCGTCQDRIEDLIKYYLS